MKTQTRIAVYAGSFDPVTFGHLWMIEAGSRMFDKLVVAIGTNPDKECHFSLEERLSMLKESISGFNNVTIDSYANQYLIKYAESIGAKYILRGIRSTADYEYEKSLSYVNRHQNTDIITIFLLPPREMIEISSSIVRGLIGPEGWEKVVSNYVPTNVLERLKIDARKSAQVKR
jgi:pantetheine-phosphate adenylyltransferase